MGQCSCIFHGYVKFSAGLNFHMTTTSGWWITNQTYRILWHLVQPQFFNSEVPNVTTCNTRMVATQETMDDPTFQEKVIWKETCPKLNFHWNWLNRPSNLGNVFFSILFISFPSLSCVPEPNESQWQDVTSIGHFRFWSRNWLVVSAFPAKKSVIDMTDYWLKGKSAVSQ